MPEEPNIYRAQGVPEPPADATPELAVMLAHEPDPYLRETIVRLWHRQTEKIEGHPSAVDAALNVALMRGMIVQLETRLAEQYSREQSDRAEGGEGGLTDARIRLLGKNIASALDAHLNKHFEAIHARVKTATNQRVLTFAAAAFFAGAAFSAIVCFWFR